MANDPLNPSLEIYEPVPLGSFTVYEETTYMLDVVPVTLGPGKYFAAYNDDTEPPFYKIWRLS